MAVGADTAPGPTEQDVEIFRSLAGMTSVALEHVRRSDEHRMVIERLADLDRMKNDFLSTVSHELRTPLTVITGMGRTLEHQWDSLDEEIRVDFLTRLNANAATLDHVIAQLLDFSKLEAGQLRPAMSEIDFSIPCCPPSSTDCTSFSLGTRWSWTSSLVSPRRPTPA